MTSALIIWFSEEMLKRQVKQRRRLSGQWPASSSHFLIAFSLSASVKFSFVSFFFSSQVDDGLFKLCCAQGRATMSKRISLMGQRRHAGRTFETKQQQKRKRKRKKGKRKTRKKKGKEKRKKESRQTDRLYPSKRKPTRRRHHRRRRRRWRLALKKCDTSPVTIYSIVSNVLNKSTYWSQIHYFRH